MSIKYNQFGKLHESIICEYVPYIGNEVEGYTIEEAFEEVAEYLELPYVFNDNFFDSLNKENIIEDMIDFFEYCDYDKNDFSSPEEAFKALYKFAEGEASEAREELRIAEETAIQRFKDKMQELNIEEEIKNKLLHNLKTKGSASSAYLEAIEEGNYPEADKLLDAMSIARQRHQQTDYDAIDKSKLSDDQVKNLRTLFN